MVCELSQQQKMVTMKIEVKLPIYEVDVIWIFVYFTWKDELDREDF